ncbi:MAG TPA: hypothetical protein VHF07_07610, partial [Nitrospiraceae bacterium]|nr:hypothetical protein [Nitrospiraceae bacterium]
AFGACTSIGPMPDLDVVDVTLPASADAVRTALTDVLTAQGYDVEQRDEGTFTTGPREEISGPWDWLLRWRFGVGKSRVEAQVTEFDAETARMRLQVFHRSKDGIFDTWQDAETPLPQNAVNQVRLVKNRLHLL